MNELVRVERASSVAIVTLNRPERRNALVPALSAQLSEALATLQEDERVRALVLTGGAHFSVGGDLESLVDGLAMRQAMQLGQRAIRSLTGGRLPVVAAVSGDAFGAGFALALACDFIVVDEDTRFGAAFGRIGLQPDYGLMWALPQRVGMGLAREILMFCEPVSGTQAHAWRLADRLAPRGEVLSTALALAERLAALPPASVATTKAALSRLPLSLDTLLAWEADTQALLIGTADFREGVSAFRERRPPTFSGR